MKILKSLVAAVLFFSIQVNAQTIHLQVGSSVTTDEGTTVICNGGGPGAAGVVFSCLPASGVWYLAQVSTFSGVVVGYLSGGSATNQECRELMRVSRFCR